MYPLDFVESFTGLSASQIRDLEKKGILHPKKEKGMKFYGFVEIYILKMTAILQKQGIRLEKISRAYDCLKNLKPDKPLSSFILFHNGKEVFDLTDDPVIIASRYGQIASRDLLGATLQPVAIGSQLEATRRNIMSWTQEIKRREKEVKKQDKLYTIDDVGQLFA
jgi:DNA-binding transcriptional MerR regulator